MFLYQTGRIIEGMCRCGLKPDMYILDVEMPEWTDLRWQNRSDGDRFQSIAGVSTSHTKYMPSVFEVVTFDLFQNQPKKRLRVLFEKAGTYLNLTKSL
ncbi:hypothetical protein [Roseburia intestinalis]